jgi:predicted transcriptional regulator
MEQTGSAHRILEEVGRSPGIHHRELQRRLAMTTGVFEYHVHRLVKERQIIERREGGFVRYFPERGLTERERTIMAFLRQDVPRLVVICLLDSPGLRHREILERVDVSGATLSTHLARMAKSGVLTEERGGPVRYRVSDPETVRGLLRSYRPSFMDLVLDQIVEAWER